VLRKSNQTRLTVAVAWTEIFLLYPLTGASIAHKLLARGLKTSLGFKDDGRIWPPASLQGTSCPRRCWSRPHPGNRTTRHLPVFSFQILYNRGRMQIPSCTSSHAGSSVGSPDRRVYRNFSAKDLADLTEREQLWREQGITEETRVFAAMLYSNNVAPEQILLQAGCADFHAYHHAQWCIAMHEQLISSQHATLIACKTSPSLLERNITL
jgi:hypothetical protein